MNPSIVWSQLITSALVLQTREPFLSDVVGKYILTQREFGQALAVMLSHELEGKFSWLSWYKVFESAVREKYDTSIDANAQLTVEETCLADLTGIMSRDPACEGLVHAFLNFKGFKALASHRMAHVLWRAGRKEVALAIQSRCCDVFAVDIHPAARIGPGLMIDHATGLVVGETSTIGSNCSFLHGVTLGSSGKDKGLRHPQIGNDVLIGCNASILGYIEVGDNCKIGSGSIVLKPLPAGYTTYSTPANLAPDSSDTDKRSQVSAIKYIFSSLLKLTTSKSCPTFQVLVILFAYAFIDALTLFWDYEVN